MKAIHEQPELRNIPAPARKLAAEAIGIDSHIDTIQRVLVMGEGLGKRHDEGHVDIPRLREGGTSCGPARPMRTCISWGVPDARSKGSARIALGFIYMIRAVMNVIDVASDVERGPGAASNSDL